MQNLSLSSTLYAVTTPQIEVYHSTPSQKVKSNSAVTTPQIAVYHSQMHLYTFCVYAVTTPQIEVYHSARRNATPAR